MQCKHWYNSILGPSILGDKMVRYFKLKIGKEVGSMENLNKLEQWGQQHPFGKGLIIAVVSPIILIIAHAVGIY